MATEDATRGRGPSQRGVEAARRPLPDAETCKTVLAKMLLIRRFEERAGEMYAKAKIGGFLHLCIGEEATIVGAEQALRDGDYLMSTYREHGHALARGTPAGEVMAELFGKAGGYRAGGAARCTCSISSDGSSGATGSWVATCRWPRAWRWRVTTPAPMT